MALNLRGFIDNHCHSFELVHLYVAVKKPVAWIIGEEIDNNVSSRREHNCVLSDRMGIYRKALVVLSPPWSGTSLLDAIFFFAVNIIAVYITVVFSDKTSCWVIFWISDVNNMKCVAMKVNWMSIVISTNC